MNNKMRLDAALLERGLETSREKAKALIMSGVVFVDNQRADKAGMQVAPESAVEIRGKKLPYVSRGGLKLEKAMSSFDLDLNGRVCVDVGASTGGFTDCMLQNGASRVYAIDVGYGQLAWQLRNDPRVVNMERTNIRYVKPEDIGELACFASVDVSFISLSLVLPALRGLLADGAEVVLLVKPQFEAGREKVGKKGVVRELSTHIEVLEKAFGFAGDNGFAVRGADFSPIKGPEGNIEYLLYVVKGDAQNCGVDAAELAKRSHQLLSGELV